MPVIEFCCLANSHKWNGRCIAGIHLPTGRWVRLVSDGEKGELYPRHYALGPDGDEPRIFDCIRVELQSASPHAHHPEDWLIAPKSWELISRPQTTEDYQQLREQLSTRLVKDPELLGNLEDRIPYSDFLTVPAEASLAIICPELFFWQIERRGGKQKTRAVFTLHSQRYELGMTDPIWRERLAHLTPGTYSLTKIGIPANAKLWLTISLSEPFQEHCFKLVATVIVWPG